MSINWWNESSGSVFQNPSPAYQRFLKSMKIGYIEWHDGIGYDLESLKEMDLKEFKWVESLMISRKDQDWREVEALAAINTPAAIGALKECLSSKNIDVKLFAVKFLKEMEVVDRIDEIVTETLPTTKIGDGLSYALSLIEKYPSERLKEMVLWCVLNGNEDIRIHCAAMALFLYGKATTPLDYDQKIIFEFKENDRSKRIISFLKFCQMIGVNGGKYTYLSAADIVKV